MLWFRSVKLTLSPGPDQDYEVGSGPDSGRATGRGSGASAVGRRQWLWHWPSALRMNGSRPSGKEANDYRVNRALSQYPSLDPLPLTVLPNEAQYARFCGSPASAHPAPESSGWQEPHRLERMALWAGCSPQVTRLMPLL